MTENDTTQAQSDIPAAPEEKLRDSGPLEPRAATERGPEDESPPLHISGFGPLGQATPDVATGSTPVTRHDE